MPEDLQLWKGFNGHGLYAKRAEKDRNGEDIVTTYAKQSEVPALTDDLTSSTTTAVTPNAVKEAIDAIVKIPDTANQPSTLYVGGQGMGWTGWETEEVDIPVVGVDIGGRTYKIVTIGTQTWLAENLDYKFVGLNPGQADYYNDDETTYGVNGNKYGLLYKWNAVKYLNDNRAALIPGWHVPSADEWDALYTTVGGINTAGKKLKSMAGWTSGNGDDEYGFTGFPTGFSNRGSFTQVGEVTYYWTSTEESTNFAKARRFTTADKAGRTNDYKDCGMSVRLIKDT